MNQLKYGDLVKIKHSDDYFKIEGYHKKIASVGKTTHTTVVYRLKNIRNNEVLYRTKNDICMENVEIVDFYLDQYNDYMCLYEVIGDEMYKQKAEETMKSLKEEW